MTAESSNILISRTLNDSFIFIKLLQYSWKLRICRFDSFLCYIFRSIVRWDKFLYSGLVLLPSFDEVLDDRCELFFVARGESVVAFAEDFVFFVEHFIHFEKFKYNKKEYYEKHWIYSG